MKTKAMTSMKELGRRGKAAGYRIAGLSTDRKNAALHAIADLLEERQAEVLGANALDLQDAEAAGLDDALLDRLRLNESRMAGLAADTRDVADLPDPVGQDFDGRVLPNGLRISKRRIPLGVVGVIYEARPNVTIDIAGLCLKTGNAVILRGGSETYRSNVALVGVIEDALESEDLPGEAVQYVEDTDRARVTELLKLDEYVDMIVPRGGSGLHRLCREEATIPVITGGIGICHVYVDETADRDQAVEIIENAKVQRPSVCNALDTLLVHRSVASDFLPVVSKRLAESGVELRATPDALAILEEANGCRVRPAGPDDFDQEWLGLTLGVRLVDSLDEAVDHIRAHSTEHSDSILTRDLERANSFVNAIDSSAVFVNASTRFNDGGQFGLGAEVAVSTQKLHARGPMGLQELTTYKWVVLGQGQIRP